MKLAAVILAAGASSRMGGFPKALLTHEGETFVARLVRLFAAQCGKVVVVLGYSSDTVRLAVPETALVVVNPDPSRGMLSSLQCGLAETADADAVLFMPVDCPAIRASTIAALCGVEKQSPVVIPRYQEKRGHPVRISSAIAQEILALPVTSSAQDVIRAHKPAHTYLDVEDPGVSFDVDDQAAFAALGRINAGSNES